MKSAAVLLLCAAAACTKANRSDDAEPPSNVSSTRLQLPSVHLVGADGKDNVVQVEVVRGEAELERGLMYRKKLDADAGMLFMMGEERDHTFWMKNTYIPLDMIFIKRDMTVGGVAADAVPLSEDLRSVGVPTLYVLEVNAGWAKKHGVGAGAKVRFENVAQ